MRALLDTGEEDRVRRHVTFHAPPLSNTARGAETKSRDCCRTDDEIIKFAVSPMTLIARPR